MCCTVCRCIDGYSRKILWLRASYTNHHPAVVATYFLDTVSSAGEYPAHVRSDCGTENGTIAAIQSLVTGSTASHIYGSSPGNQRIECWWSFFRRSRSQWWLELFEDLTEFGAFHPGCCIEVECLRFCFIDVIQRDLDEARQQWNSHRIRPSSGARCPAGVVDELYYLPQLPATDCLLRNSPALPDEILNDLMEPRTCEDTQLYAYFSYLCQFHGLAVATDADSAAKLYFAMMAHTR